MFSTLYGVNQLICRCCLLENPKLTYSLYDNNLCYELYELAPKLNIVPNDGLPDMICDLCLCRLRDALEFRRRCEETDSLLRQRHEQTLRALEEQDIMLNDALESIAKEVNSLEQQQKQQQKEQEQQQQQQELTLLSSAGNEPFYAQTNHLELSNLEAMKQLPFDAQEFNEYFPADYDMLPSTPESIMDLDNLVKEIYVVAPAYETTTITTETKTETEAVKSSTAATTTTSVEPKQGQLVERKKRQQATATSKTKSHNRRSIHPCSECEKKFTRNFQLKLHLISVHNIGDGLRYQCNVCLKTFASRHSLKYHYTSIHSEERPFQCEYCARRFILRTQLSSHLRIHTGEMQPRIYVCTKCGKTWPTQSGLRTHMRTHNPELERPFKCKLCEKAFFTRGHLDSHKLVHTGEKPFACNFCERSYQSVGNLNNHMVRQHADIITNQTDKKLES